MLRSSLNRIRSSFQIVFALWCALSLFLNMPQSADAGQASNPDLVVSSISNPPASAMAGTSFSVTDTTGNSGNATANASTTRYRLSVDNVINSSDSLLTGSRSVPSLKKGASSSGSVTVTIPAGQTLGTYYLGACADDPAVITESSETNNCRPSTTTIVVTGPASISNLSPSSGPTGTVVIINGSNFGATQGSSTVSFNGVSAAPTNWTATAITVPVPVSASTGPVVVTVGGVPSNGSTFTVTYSPRVNAGGPDYTDATGKVWSADRAYGTGPWGYVGGTIAHCGLCNIAGTVEDPLYQWTRYGTFSYQYDVPNGQYDVTLHFAETYWSTAGNRIFDVLIEGVLVLDDYDPATDVGPSAAITKTFRGVQVSDGQLKIDFVPTPGSLDQNPIISAIFIEPTFAKLAITSINGGTSPTAGVGFPVVVQAQNPNGVPINVLSALNVNLSLKNGAGVLGGTLSGAIPVGASQVTINGVTYSKADSGVILSATATGNSANPGDSAPFTVLANVATNLAFNIQPGNATTSGAITGPPTVTVKDSQGNIVTSSTAQITIAIGNNPGGGTLTGTATKNASGGVATFADLKINQPGNGYTLNATAPGLTAATSNAFNVLAAGSVSGTVTKAAGGGAIAGASVQALQSGIVKGTASTNASGSYTLTGLVPGAYDIRASAGGFAPQTQNGVTVSSGATATANFSLAVAPATAGIVYIYDELQRLKSVIDPVGEAATYSYDAVGNLLGIVRNNSSQTSIIDFNPNSGAVGSTVTIYGTGYSATPSQNTVTFNGVAATVTTSSATQIVTTVPAGATTGAIAVTSLAGSATSATNFTVSGAVGAPTIASLTPNIGPVGTSVTITGTNFDPTAANNEVHFSPTLAVVTTATTTTIQTSVPSGARPGRITVSNSNGTAMSSQDFFIPPSPYTEANVEYTGRIGIGGSNVPVTLSANKIGLLLFDAVAGQKISLGVVGVTVFRNFSILNPDRSTLASAGFGGAGGTFDRLLTQNGTYTVVLGTGSSAGSATLTLSEDLNVGPIAINGSSVTVTINRVGQDAVVTFVGSAGQTINLGVSGVTVSTTVSINNPDGSQIASTLFGGAGGTIDRVLTQNGTYTIRLNAGVNTGSLTLTLSEEMNAGTISINGSSVTVTINRIGQDAVVTFVGSAGQTINLGVSGVTVFTTVSINNPDGSLLGSGSFGGAGGTIDRVLTQNGTYTIRLNAGVNTGSLTLTLSEEMNAGTIAINGSSVTVTLNRIGQNARLTFSGTAGQTINLGVSAAGPSAFVSIWNPDGSQIASTLFGGAGGTIDRVLTQDGLYSIVVDPGVNLGSLTLTLSEELNAGTITINGSSVTVTINRIGQDARLTFTGDQSQNITLLVTNVTVFSGVYIYPPGSGTPLTSGSFGGAGGSLGAQLPTTGMYSIRVDSGVGTGSVTLTLTSP